MPSSITRASAPAIERTVDRSLPTPASAIACGTRAATAHPTSGTLWYAARSFPCSTTRPLDLPASAARISGSARRERSRSSGGPGAAMSVPRWSVIVRSMPSFAPNPVAKRWTAPRSYVATRMPTSLPGAPPIPAARTGAATPTTSGCPVARLWYASETYGAPVAITPRYQSR